MSQTLPFVKGVSQQVAAVKVEISVVLGRSNIPMQHLLRMGRGAVIELDASENDPMRIYANQTLVALGEIKIDDGQVAIEVKNKVTRRS